jgi:hypothetical protein
VHDYVRSVIRFSKAVLVARLSATNITMSTRFKDSSLPELHIPRRLEMPTIQSSKLQQTARKLGLSVKSLEQYMTTKAAEIAPRQQAGKPSKKIES